MTSNKLFGTDGIRGHINSTHLHHASVDKLGKCIAQLVRTIEENQQPPTILIARDTRESGPDLEKSLVSGITSMGVDVKLLGIIPTAALAYIAKRTRHFGVMISASHNPYHDNGLKVFDHDGFKISQEREIEIEKHYAGSTFSPLPRRGNVTNAAHEIKIYKDMIASVFKKPQKKMNIVVDCAHGAAVKLAKDIFLALDINARFLGVTPNGRNINRRYGSVHPHVLRRAVLKHKACLGIAFDGDADRVIFISENGDEIAGDAILAVFARHLIEDGSLQNNTIASTIMSSYALDNAVAKHDIKVIRTDVGDKFVARAMAHQGLNLGGENSGHLIYFPHTTTGDGIFSALQFIHIMSHKNQSASQLVSFYEPTPQSITNIDVIEKIPLDKFKMTQALIHEVNDQLKNKGRVMLRYSGTENKARLLVEANTVEECDKIAKIISNQFGSELMSLPRANQNQF